MENLDTPAVAQLLVRLGLVAEEQLIEAYEEVDPRGADPEPLLRFLERKGYLTPWQSQKVLKRDPDGYFLGGYRILYKIASGSFGRVFRADDVRSGRVVAIKVLRRRWSEDPQRIEFFEREGRVGMSLRHPNIVEMLAVNRDPASGQYYMVMEFVEGGNLREILAIRKQLEPAEALRLIEDAASGLAYAYSRGVTHRDVKLTNILLSSQGTAKLVDFGLAKIYSSLGVKNSERVERTVDYAGLEKATNVKSGDVRSDIYFLGCVLYEALTGRPPLQVTRDRFARMQRQRFDNVAPMKREDVNAPASVFTLVETMMSLDPQRRYQTPSQLLDAIKAARRDLEGKNEVGSNNHVGSARSIFVAEADVKLQDKIREKFKELGYRVLLAADPVRALDRFRTQPFDAFVLDARTVGEEGLPVFERIMKEADRRELRCAGIILLGEDQSRLTERLGTRPNVAVMTHPI
ncbi:MAG TPA: serine/threonine-protein kinase, partial [Gemmataceae bacterium]|nr:serine/threonine-protein kinase [Gemmataceae bacterium]